MTARTAQKPEKPDPGRLVAAEEQLASLETRRAELEGRLAQFGPLTRWRGAGLSRVPPAEARNLAIELRRVEDEVGVVAAEVGALRRLGRAPAMTAPEAARAIEEAVEREVAAGQEAAAAKEELRDATRVGDVARVVEARRRLEAVPVVIGAAQVARLRAEAALARAEEEALPAAVEAAAAEMARSSEAAAEAERVFHETRARALECHAEYSRLRTEGPRLRKRVNELLARVEQLAEKASV